MLWQGQRPIKDQKKEGEKRHDFVNPLNFETTGSHQLMHKFYAESDHKQENQFIQLYVT